MTILLSDTRIKRKRSALARRTHSFPSSEIEHSGLSSSRCQDNDSEDDDSDNQEAAHSDAENDDQTNSTVRSRLPQSFTHLICFV